MIICFKTVSARWISFKKNYVKESTISVYEEIIKNHLLDYFKSSLFIKNKEVQRFVLLKIREGLSQKMVKDIVIVLKMICMYGKKSKIFKYEAFDIIYPVKEEAKEVSIISKRDQIKLQNSLLENVTYKGIGIALCLMTGLRIGELCALTVGDVDFSTKEIIVRKTIQRIYCPNEKKKTRIILTEPKTISSNRVVPISSVIFPTIKENYKALGTDVYLLSGTKKPIEPRCYRKYFKSELDKLNIKQVKFHALRHTFATRCIESNSDYKTVSSLLGHSNISTTLNLYVHPNKEQKRKCVERMEKLLTN